jgi:hypothetical protein
MGSRSSVPCPGTYLDRVWSGGGRFGRGARPDGIRAAPKGGALVPAAPRQSGLCLSSRPARHGFGFEDRCALVFHLLHPVYQQLKSSTMLLCTVPWLTNFINQLKEPKGSSRPKIKSYIKENFAIPPNTTDAAFNQLISKALNTGVTKEILERPKGESRVLPCLLSSSL